MVTAVAASAAAPLISLRRLKPPAAAPADWSGAFIWLVTVSSQDFFCWEGNREPTFRHKAGDVGEATRDGREECEGRAEPIVQCVIPAERRDPYAVSSRFSAGGRDLPHPRALVVRGPGLLRRDVSWRRVAAASSRLLKNLVLERFS